MTNSVLRGKQTPRIGNFPDYETTAGELVIRFAETPREQGGLGFKLYEWQKDIFRHALGEVVDPLDDNEKIWAASDVGIVIPRQNGKTFLIDILCLAGMFLFDERIVITSQSRNNAKKILLRVAEIIEQTPSLKTKLTKRAGIVRTTGSEQINLQNGAGLEICARGKDGPRGGTFDRLINDEAYDLTNEDLASLIPVLSSRPNPQAWYLSTPPLNAVTGEPFTKLRKRGIEKASRVAWFEWGADPDKPVDLDDRQVWADTNPSFNLGRYGVKETTVESERHSMTEADFARERLGVWPVKADDGFIRPESWQRLADPLSLMAEPKGNVAFAVDTCGWGEKAKTAIVAYGIRADGRGHVELIRQGDGTEWVVDALVELKEQWNPVAIGFDVKGPIGGSVLLDLQTAGINVPAKADEPGYADLAVPTPQEFSAACIQFVDSITQATIRHTDQPQLSTAVTGGRTKKYNDSWMWDRHKSPVDISPLVAATLARWAYETRAHLVRHEIDIMKTLWLG